MTDDDGCKDVKNHLHRKYEINRELGRYTLNLCNEFWMLIVSIGILGRKDCYNFLLNGPNNNNNNNNNNDQLQRQPQPIFVIDVHSNKHSNTKNKNKKQSNSNSNSNNNNNNNNSNISTRIENKPTTTNEKP
uniref:Uncharacterized protein n=1 Tax=Glossina palpalis gambiensis TaxID=67801 RepID=A0A1B0AV98_9MUSC